MKACCLATVLGNEKILTFFAVSFFLFSLYLLPLTLPVGRPLDLHLYYRAEDAYQLIKSYGEYNRLTTI
jgi:hypothetical protein